jgi:ferredoxin hydrogenase large subunit
MSEFRVNQSCNGCLACVQNCPGKALAFRDEGDSRTLLHNLARCARCATCWRVCPQDAIEFHHLLSGEFIEVVTLGLVRCTECGQPVCTAGLGESLDEKAREMTVPLCERHRAAGQARQRLPVPGGRS